MDERLANADARVTRAGSAALAAQPRVEPEKRKRVPRIEEEDGEGTSEEEGESEDDPNAMKAGDANLLPESDDDSWAPPQPGAGQLSDEEEDELEEERDSSQGSGRETTTRQRDEGNIPFHENSRDRHVTRGNHGPKTLRLDPQPGVACEKKSSQRILLKTQKRREQGDHTDGAALLAQLIDSFMERPNSNQGASTRHGSVSTRQESPQRRRQQIQNQEPARVAQPPPRQTEVSAQAPTRRTHGLIQDNLTKASYEQPEGVEDHLPKRPRAQRSQSPKDQTSKSKSARVDQTEAERAKTMLMSRKGRMVLSNGDVIENGRLIVLDDSTQMEKSLPELSPVLTVYMQTFKAYIPLSVFERNFLREDAKGWSTKKAPTATKILEGNGTRVYGGDPPMDELTMQYEQWLDAITLFIRYVKQAEWQTQAERFEGHKLIVMDLRENVGWMVALRYCQRVRQGLMRATVDRKIYNITKVQNESEHSDQTPMHQEAPGKAGTRRPA
ncbi:uncharacterized protein MELLADRAFT_85049 [Melampsora larici-populina 98AG31]|uniref:Uncharacterized protein n=1 Tax=Melampsora larici-populina (strain 98AG31 / pathotype 3-4-7) TaxID=747676 RepID=F4RHB0_MELLP|nr:uncharacterized protein MELLADRAFT_85049 [Melampsora larici-populina 98AG31]EGG08283.1 hypothetical protein MELLADRAFT_85049 [Melampsora larici-populina 98AG31]